MNSPTTRRELLQAAAFGAGLTFLGGLPRVSAQEAKLDPKLVRLDGGIEPVVRLIEETPRDRLLEEVADRIRKGLSYQEVLAGLLLAGVRNVQPRPAVGFKFHAVLVVNSAHLASLASSDEDRWLPIFWALDYFKSSQAATKRESGWRMGPVEERLVPPARKARQAFVDAMDKWDEPAADAAIAALARTAGANEVFELMVRFGARDFRDIGHKAIFVANSFRTLSCIGWQHAEPVLRFLAYALLKYDGGQNPANADLDPDRPWKQNAELAQKLRDDWQQGAADPAATKRTLAALRSRGPGEIAGDVVEAINGGAAPSAMWDALLASSGELLMRKPGIVALHAVTSTNAMHYAYQTSADDETRRRLLLQNAAFVTLFRQAAGADKGTEIDTLEPESPKATGPEAVAEIFEDVSRDRLMAARKTLAYVKDERQAQELMQAARRLVFLKGRDSHDYKFSSAVLEDFAQVAPGWRERFLASAMFHFRGAGDGDNTLVQRTRAALK